MLTEIAVIVIVAITSAFFRLRSEDDCTAPENTFDYTVGWDETDWTGWEWPEEK